MSSKFLHFPLEVTRKNSRARFNSTSSRSSDRRRGSEGRRVSEGRRSSFDGEAALTSTSFLDKNDNDDGSNAEDDEVRERNFWGEEAGVLGKEFWGKKKKEINHLGVRMDRPL